MTANEFVQVNGVATAGASCSPNGLIGRDASGGILSCQSGVWSKIGGEEKISTYSSTFPNNKIDMGQHSMCALSYVRV
ncbi:shufflon system plasmid conjugative transfer pilus tip adhesin PilV, partial [Enterobacter hormaechei subsp. steigerwaltii]|nr:shufflon system plasmid conjugative transfer pilus tip adhesin PilV [Enterobacter hormaechei subsp. steigerwaltii]